MLRPCSPHSCMAIAQASIIQRAGFSLGMPTRRAIDPTDIFDLSGRLVRRHADTTDGLPSGIYLRGGRKIVIK